MSNSQLLEHPTPSRHVAAQAPIRRSNVVGIIILVILGSFLTAVFVKLLDYEINHSFKWLHRTVYVDAAWY